MRPAIIAVVGLCFLVLIFAGVLHIRLVLLAISTALCALIATGFWWQGHKPRSFAISTPAPKGDTAAAHSSLAVNIEGRRFTADQLPPRMVFTLTCRNLLVLVVVSTIGIAALLVSLFVPGGVVSGPSPDSGIYYFFYVLCYFLVALCFPALTWMSESALLRGPGITLARIRQPARRGWGTKWVAYEFRDPAGGYYGGSVADFGGPKGDQFKVVFCSPAAPNFNKLSCGLFFHQVVWADASLT